MKVVSYADIPEDLISYGELSDKHGKRQFKLTLRGQTKNHFIAIVEGITDRTEAEKITNTELFVLRSALPAPTADQYYQNDLLGMKIVKESGEDFGTIGAFHNFGAGTLVDVRFENGASELFSFTKATFPSIDIAKKTLTISLPEIVE